jgi:GntR family transcriptional repressor for pyruvate dehydrogenase complex
MALKSLGGKALGERETVSEESNEKKGMALFKNVKPRKVSDEIFEQIKALIFSGKLSPSDKLPPERELAKFLNVGRSSLREALVQLSTVGLIEARKTNGFFVRSMSEDIVGPMKSFIEDELRNLIDFMEVRKMLDIYCAKEAIKRGTYEDMDKIRGALEQGDNNRFHAAIAEATHNVILYHVMSDMYDLLSTIAFIKKRRQETGNASVRHHKKIYEALVNRDPDAAEEAVKEHLDFFISAAKGATGSLAGNT